MYPADKSANKVTNSKIAKFEDFKPLDSNHPGWLDDDHAPKVGDKFPGGEIKKLALINQGERDRIIKEFDTSNPLVVYRQHSCRPLLWWIAEGSEQVNPLTNILEAILNGDFEVKIIKLED